MKNKSLAFSVQTMQTVLGNGLKSIKPVKDGVYKGVPLAVIGKPSRNNVVYDQNSFVESITNPNTRFYKSLVEGGLEGEWGHPMNIGLNNKDAIMRTMQIDGSRVSHYFTKVYAKKTKDGEYYVVYGDIVPFGPNGQYLAASFQDTKRNTAFSLRSLTTDPESIGGGLCRKKILALITFDAVNTPGYQEACKCFMDTGEESFKYELTEEQIISAGLEDFATVECAEVIGQETVSHQSLLDLLETDSVTLATKEISVVGNFDKKTGSIRTGTSNISAFHGLFR